MWSMLLYCVLLNTAFAKRESRLVQTEQGPVKGYKNKEHDIFEFHGIPYATIPSGGHRFKAPLPPPKWDKPFQAVNKNIVCQQTDYTGLMAKNVIMQEDCLIANVFVPEKQDRSYAVLVYIHGGAFLIGSGNMMTPVKLVASKNIIAVTFNYRLSAHGFLCLGTEDIPGNAGMKDQVALLRWIKRNIANFGGDPNEVTIAGYSAGSSSVDLLMISKMAKGLFKRVILESGANNSPFSVQANPLQSAKEYARMLNFDKVDDIHALEHFFKTIPLEKLNSANVWLRPDSTFLIAPCIEREVKEESFLDENSVNRLRIGHYEIMPMLCGFANMEGLFRASLFDLWKNEMNEKFSNFLPANLQFESDQEKEEVAYKIKQFYFGDKLVGPETILGYINYFSDVMFVYPTLRSMKSQVDAGNSNVYLYEYSYVDDTTPLVPHTNIRGANHIAQTSAVLDGLKASGYQTVFSEKYLKMIKTMRDIWHSFITTGKPTNASSHLPEWPPVNKNWSPCMSLNETLELRGSHLKDRAEFWEKIYDKYYRTPIPPSSFITKEN